MAETSGLLNRRRGITPTEGSNPSVSANFPLLSMLYEEASSHGPYFDPHFCDGLVRAVAARRASMGLTSGKVMILKDPRPAQCAIFSFFTSHCGQSRPPAFLRRNKPCNKPGGPGHEQPHKSPQARTNQPELFMRRAKALRTIGPLRHRGAVYNGGAYLEGDRLPARIAGCLVKQPAILPGDCRLMYSSAHIIAPHLCKRRAAAHKGAKACSHGCLGHHSSEDSR